MAVQTVVIDISQMKKDVQKKQKIEDRLGKSIQKTKNQVLKIDNTKGILDLKVTDTTIKVLYKIAKGLERETRALEQLPQKVWKTMRLFLKEFDDIMRKTNRLLEKILDKLGRPPNRTTNITNMGVSSSTPKAAKVKPKIKFSTGSTSDRFHGVVDESLGTGVRISKNVGTGFGELKKGAQSLKEPAKKIGKRVGNRLATGIGAVGLTLGTDIKLRGAAAETSLHATGGHVQSSMGAAGATGETALTGFGASLESGIKRFGTYLKTRLTTAGSSMGGSIGGIVTSFGGLLESGMNTLGSAANTVFKAAGRGFKTAFSGIGSVANSFIKSFGTAIKTASDKIGNGIIHVTGNIKNIAKGAFGIASMVGGIVKGIVGGIVGFFKNLMKAAWEGIKNWGIKPILQYESTMGAAQGYQYLFAKKGGNVNEFEDKLDEIVIDSPYSRETIHNLGKSSYNMSTTGNEKEIIDDMVWTQDLASSFGLDDNGYASLLSGVVQNKHNDTTITLDDLKGIFGADIPITDLITLGMTNGEYSQEAKLETEGKLKTEGIQAKDIIGALEYVSKMEDPLEVHLDSKTLGKDAKQILENPIKGAAKALADGTISGLKMKIANLFDSKIMSKWGTGLATGISSGLQRIGKFLDEHEEELTKLGDFLQEVGEKISDALSSAIQSTLTNINELLADTDFQNADMATKMKMFWQQIIQDPFNEWWEGSGQPLVDGVLKSMSRIAGQALTGFLSILFGMGAEDSLGAFADAGSSFVQGFAEGFDGEMVWDAFMEMADRIGEKVGLAVREIFFPWEKDARLAREAEEKEKKQQERNIVDTGLQTEKEEADKALKEKGYKWDSDYALKNYDTLGVEEKIIIDDMLQDIQNLYAEHPTVKRWQYKDEINRILEPKGQTEGEFQAGIYEAQSDHIKLKTEEVLYEETGYEGTFDEALANYNTLGEEQRAILDEGIQKVIALKGEFSFLEGTKYADIVVRAYTQGPNGGLVPLNAGIFNMDDPDPNSTLYPYAKGGILTSPHVGLVAEAGPEAIIPLSGAYKSNGISLWEKAGYLLGTLPKHAEGGIFGEINEKKNGRSYFSLASNAEEEEQESNSEWISNMNAPVQVNLGGVVFNFHGAEAKEQESIMKVIKEQMPTIADEIAGTIAVNIQRIFSNMKKEIV